MLLVIKDNDSNYFSGYNTWDKQLRKAKIYTSHKMDVNIRDDMRFKERELTIFHIEMRELGEYSPYVD